MAYQSGDTSSSRLCAGMICDLDTLHHWAHWVHLGHDDELFIWFQRRARDADGQEDNPVQSVTSTADHER